MATSAFIVRVREAEACVGDLRREYDETAQLGVPAHITILAPFMEPERIDGKVLQEVRAAFAGMGPFSYSLGDVRYFPTTAYLAPEPAGPFVALTRALVAAYPAFPPYGGLHSEITPHLTMAHGSAENAAAAGERARRWLADNGPIRAMCDSVVLLENSQGAWREMHVFALAA